MQYTSRTVLFHCVRTNVRVSTNRTSNIVQWNCVTMCCAAPCHGKSRRIRAIKLIIKLTTTVFGGNENIIGTRRCKKRRNIRQILKRSIELTRVVQQCFRIFFDHYRYSMDSVAQRREKMLCNIFLSLFSSKKFDNLAKRFHVFLFYYVSFESKR